MIFSLKCKVRIDGRREKRNGEQHQVDLKTLLVESSTWRGVIRTTTITCLAAAHKGPVVARTCVTLDVKLDINSWRGFDFGFDHLNGVPTALIEDVSSTETSPIREPAPAINPTKINTLPDSAEKVKAKAECEISLPKF